MVKATLRKANAPQQPVIDVQSTVVSTSTAGAGESLESLVDAPAPTAAVPATPQNGTSVPAAVVNPTGTAAPVTQQPTTNLAALTIPDQHQAPAHRAQGVGGDGFEGEWDKDDLKFPQLKLVQGSGPLSAEWDAGTVLYADLKLLPAPSVEKGAKNPVLRFVPLLLTKQFREKLTQDQIADGDMPRIAGSIDEVEELGGTTKWIGSSQPDNYWEPSARCLFLLEKPENSDHEGFSLELDGKMYGVAVYYAAGGAFRSSAKIILNTAMTSLLTPVLGADNLPQKTPTGQIIKRPLLWKNVWTINFAKVQAGNFTPWRPVVKLLKEETGPEVREYCAQNSSTASAHAEKAGE